MAGPCLSCVLKCPNGHPVLPSGHVINLHGHTTPTYEIRYQISTVLKWI